MSVVVADVEEPKESSEAQVWPLEVFVRMYDGACSWYKDARSWYSRLRLGSCSESAPAKIVVEKKANVEPFFARYHRLGESYMHQLASYEASGGVPPEPIETLVVSVSKGSDLDGILAPVEFDDGAVLFSKQGRTGLYVDSAPRVRHVREVLEERLLYHGCRAHIGHGKGRLSKLRTGKVDVYKCDAMPKFEDYYYFPQKVEKSES